MNHPYIDLHTHTCLSDGNLTPVELLREAREAGIGILAMTDHNSTEDLTAWRAAFPELTLIQGAEITCRYLQHELHVVALGIDPENPKLRAVLEQNQPDRRPYLTAILDKLRALGLDVGTYDELQAANPHSRYFGRMQIAKEMVNRGYVNSADEAFDIYMGAHGQRLAYVANPLKYVSLEEAVEAYPGAVLMVSHDFYTIANCVDSVLFVENGTVRPMSGRAFRKMIYKHHFNKDYLLLEQQKKELEIRIAHCLKAGDCVKAQTLCDQLGDVVDQM